MSNVQLIGTTAYLSLLLACVVAVIAGFQDLRTWKISNTLTYGAFALGCAIALATGTLGSALGGAAIAGGSGLILYIFRAMGGGDVKLLAAIGSLLGYPLSLEMLFFGVLFGGAWSIFALCLHGRMLQTLKELWLLVRSLIYPRVPLFVPAQGVHVAGGVVIAAATLWVVLPAIAAAYLPV